MTITIRKEEKQILLHTEINYGELEDLLDHISDGHREEWTIVGDALLPEELLEETQPQITTPYIPPTTPYIPPIYPTNPLYPDPNYPWIVTCEDSTSTIKTNFGDIVVKDSKPSDITYKFNDGIIPNMEQIDMNTHHMTFEPNRDIMTEQEFNEKHKNTLPGSNTADQI